MKQNSSHLSPQLLSELQKQLETQKEQLEKELSSFATKDARVQGDWDSKFPRTPQGNLEEAADEVEEYSTRLPVEFSLETRLKDINAALEKIKTDNYGICERCGKLIAAERLRISPEAKFCQECNR